ncbi:Exocyst complex component 5, partial [Coelomomyces lativittatus]
MYRAFNTLESRVVEVANTAVRIGEQLETIDKQRAKAFDVKELLLFFMDFNMGVSDRLEGLRSQPEGQLSVARIARRLQQVAKDVDAPGTEQARPGIEKYCELFETDLLRQFLNAAEKRDIETMKLCSETLNEYNGGESCLKAWINQHPLFTATPARISKAFENPDEPDPGFRKLLEQFYVTLYQDWDVVSNVFSSPQTVLTTMIQRFFQQAVQNYLEQLMKLAASISDEFFLKTLASNLSAAKSLASDLVHFDETVLKRVFVSPFVDRCAEEVFSAYTETSTREQSLLNHIIQKYLSEAFTYYANRKQQKKSIFSRIQKPMAALENMLSTDNVMQVLTLHAKSIERCRLIHNEPHLSAFNLFISLCDSVYIQYLEVALDAALEEAHLQDGKLEPDFRSLLTVQSSNTIMHLMQAHFITVVVPVIAPFPPTHREVIQKKTAMISVLERKCNAIVIHLMNVALLYIQSLLAKQKKTDFKHKEGELPNHSLSPTCSSICDFLFKVLGHVQSYLDGENAKKLLIEIGKQCHILLLEHFKKFPVSNMGALTLS